MMRRLVPAIPLVMLLALAGCEDHYYPVQPPPGDTLNILPSSVENTAWRLVSFETGNGIDTVDPTIRVTLVFSGSTVHGVAGCNEFNGSFQAGDTTITFSSLSGSAKNWCPGALSLVESRYIAALNAATLYRIRAGRLRIMYDGLNALNFVADQGNGDGTNDTMQYWKEIAPIGTGRIGHTATVLSQGAILVTGGTSPDLIRNGTFDATGKCALYDPVTGQWQAVPDMKMPRAGHTATLLNNRSVLVVGGSSAGNSVTESLGMGEIYDPSTGQWRTAAPLSTNRSDHTATLLPSGDVLVTGGYDEMNFSLATCAIYRVATNSWDSSVASMSMPRSRHTAVLLDDGTVLVSGGDAPGMNMGSCEIYDPASNTWRLAPGPSGGQAMMVLDDGSVLAVGPGMEHAEIAMPNGIATPIGGWRVVPGIKSGGAEFPSLLKLCSGKVLLTGFIDGSCMIYDPRTDAWSEISPMKYPRYIHTPVLTRQCKVIVIGGLGIDGGFVAPCELYEE